MIVPTDDEWLDVGLVVERNRSDDGASVSMCGGPTEQGELWWEEDSWSAEIVVRRDGVEVVRVEWSRVEQIRLLSSRDGAGATIQLVIPQTAPDPALTLWWQPDLQFRLWTALPSQDGMFSS